MEAVGRLRQRSAALAVQAAHGLRRFNEAGEWRPGPPELCFGGPTQREKGVITPWRSIVEIHAERASERRSTIAVVVAQVGMCVRVSLRSMMSEDQFLRRVRPHVSALDRR